MIRCKRLPQTKDRSGFTLIEVMISLFILVLIGVTTTKAVTEAAKLKEVLKDETEFSNELRTSIGFIERDLNQLYNPLLLLPEDMKPIDPYNVPQPKQGQKGPPISVDEINRKLRGTAWSASEFWGPVIDFTGVRASRFKGTDKTMSFITASHVRIYREKKEGIYAKVRYEVVPQPPNPNWNKEQNERMKGLFQLNKVENTHAFEVEDPRDNNNYVTTYTVLTNIQKIRFSYYKPNEKEAVRSWDTEATESKNKYPEAVEMELTLLAPNQRTIDTTVLFRLESPNSVLPKTY